MSTAARHAEIAGAGFGGLVAAIALAERGWSVRVHERTPMLRAEGFGIAMKPNMLKVLDAVGVREAILRGGMALRRRETRNDRNEATMLMRGAAGHRVSRLHIAQTLAARAAALGVTFEWTSAVLGADPAGALLLDSGSRASADLVIGADGIDSSVRESLGLLSSRRHHRDGAMRVMVPRTALERAQDAVDGPGTCETWSGTRRVVTSPCSEQELYVALSCLAADRGGQTVPLDVESWSGAFPWLRELFERIHHEADWTQVRWVAFQTVRTSRWSRGRAAILGDAAHAMPPNLGQGAGCAMVNALSLAVALEESRDIGRALTAWEARERPLTEHTQRWSERYGQLTTWPESLRSLAFTALGRIGWLRRRYLRTENHVPVGYAAAMRPATTPPTGSDPL